MTLAHLRLYATSHADCWVQVKKTWGENWEVLESSRHGFVEGGRTSATYSLLEGDEDFDDFTIYEDYSHPDIPDWLWAALMKEALTCPDI